MSKARKVRLTLLKGVKAILSDESYIDEVYSPNEFIDTKELINFLKIQHKRNSTAKETSEDNLQCFSKFVYGINYYKIKKQEKLDITCKVTLIKQKKYANDRDFVDKFNKSLIISYAKVIGIDTSQEIEKIAKCIKEAKAFVSKCKEKLNNTHYIKTQQSKTITLN